MRYLSAIAAKQALKTTETSVTYTLTSESLLFPLDKFNIGGWRGRLASISRSGRTRRRSVLPRPVTGKTRSLRNEHIERPQDASGETRHALPDRPCARCGRSMSRGPVSGDQHCSVKPRATGWRVDLPQCFSYVAPIRKAKGSAHCRARWRRLRAKHMARPTAGRELPRKRSTQPQSKLSLLRQFLDLLEPARG